MCQDMTCEGWNLGGHEFGTLPRTTGQELFIYIIIIIYHPQKLSISGHIFTNGEENKETTCSARPIRIRTCLEPKLRDWQDGWGMASGISTLSASGEPSSMAKFSVRMPPQSMTPSAFLNLWLEFNQYEFET